MERWQSSFKGCSGNRCLREATDTTEANCAGNGGAVSRRERTIRFVAFLFSSCRTGVRFRGTKTGRVDPWFVRWCVHMGCDERNRRRDTLFIAELGRNGSGVGAVRKRSSFHTGAKATRSRGKPRTTASQSVRWGLLIPFQARDRCEQRTAPGRAER